MAGLYTSSTPQAVKFPRHSRENLCSQTDSHLPAYTRITGR